ncbi:hypothetical protein O181_043920 [Austropuccinia psidii MF-1]|uniref:MPN domain-containing protein n=1 Tax=Austropuccinia psidii MF-1 TaxID=1389203 RepID=A0A9Q3HJP6_9BASI|nr:hypothetical protein [Austropuccinia psidii MF-1]
MAHSYHLQALPSLKALLHAKKYPHSTVIGLLVGSVEAGKVLISDAIPLVHHWIDLSPMLEAGLALAEIHVKSKKLSLVGTYIAHSRADLNTLDLVSKRLNEALQFSGSIALVIDNQKLRTTENPFIPYSREGTSEWNCLENNVGVDWLINPGVHQTN